MANLSNKYLDLAGLEIFWNKANAYIKRHISGEISKIDGTNILLDNNDADSHSISYEISELWKVIGGGTPGEGSGNLSQDVSTILGAYVKSVEGDEGDYISIPIGFDIDNGGLPSIWLMYGTPKQAPDKALYEAIFGRKTAGEIARVQRQVIKQALEAYINGK